MTTKTTIIAVLLLLATSANAADFSLPLTINAGSNRTSAVIGINANATSGFDKGLDVPNPFDQENLSAFFSHPEWNVTSAGTQQTSFHRDIRGALPQTFALTISTTISPVMITWDRSIIPKDLHATISANGQSSDMKTADSLTFAPAASNSQVTIQIDPGDTMPPAAPSSLTYEIRGSSIYLAWAANTEPDLAGYTLHLLNEQGIVTRSLDLKSATNYNLMNVVNDVPYRIAVSAYDHIGNESTQSSILTAVKVTPEPLPVVAADGDIDGDGRVTIIDAVRVLRMALRLDTATTAALQHGDMDKDGSLTIRDALKIIRKVVGLQ